MTLTTDLLLYGYSQGTFPMAHEDGIYWYDPDPRTILPLDSFHVPRSLQRTLRQQKLRRQAFTVTFDRAFRQVMKACAAPGPGRESTWISPEFVRIYGQLHQMGFAHSVEIWQGEQLVGGLYGVSINSLFAGESMFSRVTDASKVALVYLVRRLNERAFLLLDVQFTTDHLRRFGASEIPRSEYRRQLVQAIGKHNSF